MFMPSHKEFTAALAPLDAQEVQAVIAGRRDARRLNWDASLPQGRLRRMLRAGVRRLTGLDEVRPFAAERLEALRLFACMMLRDDRRIEGVAERLLALGVSRGALRQAIAIALA